TDPSMLASVLSRIPDDIPDALRAQLVALAAAGDRRGMLQSCQAAGALPADLPLDLLERYLLTQHAIKLAKLRYVPPRLPVTIIHFPAAAHPDDWDMDGWAANADRVIRITVAGDHLSMVEPPHAEPLAHAICASIRESSP